MPKLKAYLMAAMLGLLLLAPLGAAAQGLKIVESFRNGDTQLDIAIFTKAPRTVGLLGIKHPGHRISYSCGIGQWEKIRALISQAAATPPGDWQEIGNITEIDTKSPSRLTVYVNQTTLRLVITDASVGTYDYLLPRSEVAAFLQQSGEAAKVMTE